MLANEEESKNEMLTNDSNKNRNYEYPKSHHYSNVIEAFAKHGEYYYNTKNSKNEMDMEESPQAVEALLDHMEEISQSITTESSWKKNIQPSMSCYNNVMKTWVASKNVELMSASRAQSIFDRMMKKMDQFENISNIESINKKNVMLNVESYEIMIQAWCHSKEGGASFKATSMLKLLEDYVKDHNINKAMNDTINKADDLNPIHGDVDIDTRNESTRHNYICHPSLQIYKTVLACLVRSSRHKTSAIKSENIINKMIQGYKANETNVKPDLECFRYVLRAWSKSTSKNAANRSEKILTLMKQNQLRPDHECYAIVIQMLSNCSSSFNDAADRADYILQQMEDAYEKIDINLQPTWKQYHDVITAWARKKSNDDAPNRAMTVFHRMEHLQNQTNDDFVIKPNTHIYTAIMKVFAYSTSNQLQKKAKKTYQLHQQMLNEYLSGNQNSKPTIESYNILLEACALSKHEDENAMQEAFGIAVDVFQELRDSFDFGNNPNNTTYHLLLDCCHNLLPPGKKKLQLIEKTFQNCCRDGLVDKLIFQKIQRMVPHWLYNQMILLKLEDSNNGRNIPTSWGANLKTKNAFNVHDDIFMFGTDDKSFGTTTKGTNNRMDQMKGLRNKVNQKLLRGGRIQG